MKRLGLLLLCTTLPLPIACDLDDRSIGDSGNDDAGDDVDPIDGGDCTEIGCEDAIFLTLESPSGVYDDGNWAVIIEDNNGQPGSRCTFSIVAGQPEDPDCLLDPTVDGTIIVHLPAGHTDATITVLKDDVVAGELQTVIEYEEVAPNGFECGPVCSQADLTITVDTALSCDALGDQFATEVEAVRSCTGANECGQVIEGTSCGCTREWVARLDADLTRFSELANSGGQLLCDWAFFGSSCDCPEADGFDCIDNECTWNYVGG